MTLRPRFAALALIGAATVLAQPLSAQQDAGVAVVTLTVNQPPGNSPALQVDIDPETVELCYNADLQQCIDAGEPVEVAWEIEGLLKDQVLRIFVKQGGGRENARGVNGSLFRSNYAATANGRLAGGRPNAPQFSSGRARWRYRVLVYDDSTGRVIGSRDPLIVVKPGP